MINTKDAPELLVTTYSNIFLSTAKARGVGLRSVQEPTYMGHF